MYSIKKPVEKLSQNSQESTCNRGSLSALQLSALLSSDCGKFDSLRIFLKFLEELFCRIPLCGCYWLPWCIYSFLFWNFILVLSFTWGVYYIHTYMLLKKQTAKRAHKTQSYLKCNKINNRTIKGTCSENRPEAVAQKCSVKKLFLEISQNSQGNTCARVSFLIKLKIKF